MNRRLTMARVTHECRRLCGEHVNRLRGVFDLAWALGYSADDAKYHAMRAVERYRQGGSADFANKCYAIKRGTAMIGKHYDKCVKAFDRLIKAEPVTGMSYLGGEAYMKTRMEIEAKVLNPSVPAPKENEDCYADY
jgi:hypothetical protein